MKDVHPGADGRFYVAREENTLGGPVYYWLTDTGDHDESNSPEASPYAYATEAEAAAKAATMFADSGRLKSAFKKIFE